MAIHHANEFIVALPEQLKDRTIQMFTISEDGPSDFNIVVSRERARVGETLDRFAERLTTALISQMPMFRVLRKEPAQLDNQPAITMDYTWLSREGPMFQRQVIFYVRASNMMIAITGTCRERQAAKWEPLYKEFLANMRLRREST